ncbi:MAG: hypothetical protein OXI90_01710 [Gammaproteobacteria bacterium]|nr:hypothetical protein [Gammaproteobacteria bacterium]
MNDGELARVLDEWGESRRLTPTRVRSLSRSIRYRRLAGAFLVVAGLGALFLAEVLALGAAATGASLTVMVYGLLSYWFGP